MPSFRFKAISAGGEVTTGVMDAPSERAVVEKLRRQGSIPIRAEPADSARAALPGLLNLRLSRRGGLSRQEIAGFTRELAIMLGAGQDLDRALRFLVETAPNARVKGVLGTLRDAVRDGAPLAVALSQEGRSFSRLYVGMVRAGESGGQLAPTLERLALMLERQRSLAATVTSAMIYP
ncbi:MAG: type II secretion system F family protein, partial [Acetobacteraceae bacterium]|nr:type II secretion system F family protein [Acetobacteraceae bacterium]